MLGKYCGFFFDLDGIFMVGCCVFFGVVEFMCVFDGWFVVVFNDFEYIFE